MRLLLDTNVVSATRRLTRQERAFQDFVGRTDAAGTYLSAITIMEIEIGIERERKRDAAFAADLDRWFSQSVLTEFADRILAFDSPSARLCAKLPLPGRQPGNDAMIAATAMAHSLTVATRNVADFRAYGVALVNPWDGIGQTPSPRR